MSDITLEGLDKLIVKAQELKKLLQDTPEILEYLRLAEKFSEEGRAVIPIPSDRLIHAGEAAQILKVNPTTINEYARKGFLTPLYTDGSGKRKFWLSQVKSVAKKTA